MPLLSSRRGAVLAAAIVLAWPAMVAPGSSAGLETTPPTPSGVRVFATAGLGLLDTETSMGASIPLGAAVLLGPARLLLNASLLDLDLLEGERRGSRYYRPSLGYSYCMDSATGQFVPDYYCSASTDVSLSASADLSYVVFDEVWFADRPAKVTLGMGHRLRRPAANYLRIGLLFPSPRTAIGAHLDLGSGLLRMGLAWGADLGRWRPR